MTDPKLINNQTIPANLQLYHDAQVRGALEDILQPLILKDRRVCLDGCGLGHVFLGFHGIMGQKLNHLRDFSWVYVGK